MAFFGCGQDDSAPGPRAALTSVGDILSAEDDPRFARATLPHPLQFPDDHGPHADYRTEWWYFTGHLSTQGGRRFGYELTVFRNALAAESPARSSRWATRDVFLCHFAMTDVARDEFHAYERFSRGALGLAGASAEPFRVWVEDWSIASVGAGTMPARLTARAGGVALDIVVEPQKPLVAHGDGGLSRKGKGDGDASYYYSYTRLAATGTVEVDGERHAVTGSSWMDHEWSTSALAPDQVGWDWFALQFDTGEELMLFALRDVTGAQTFGSGSWIDRAGEVEALTASDFSHEVTGETELHGVRYPSRWRVRVPGRAVDVEVTPLIADQELRLSVRYWEGAVNVRDRAAAVVGAGYVELTGYAGGGGRE